MPPADPNRSEGKFVLPSSPWTYGNESFNPNLEPSNDQLRPSASGSIKRRHGASAVPPYHPDYDDTALTDSSDDSSDEVALSAYTQARWGQHVRRGSEGYEVKAINREEVFRQHVESQLGVPGRYHTYEPEPDVGSDSDVGKDASSRPPSPSLYPT